MPLLNLVLISKKGEEQKRQKKSMPLLNLVLISKKREEQKRPKNLVF
jgi:hypothetical protein